MCQEKKLQDMPALGCSLARKIVPARPLFHVERRDAIATGVEFSLTNSSKLG